jgi:ATP-dependent Lhr-like helicase
MADQPTIPEAFHAPVRAWFSQTFGQPTGAQAQAWPAILSGESTLILAPTGSGKTLAAFLAAIDHVMFAPAPPRAERCRVLYVSPLKALAVDVERNLRAPLRGVARTAGESGVSVHIPEVAIRTGDTPARERRHFAANPADILITTPESLFLLLTSGARATLRTIRWVIVDEIHTMVATKRGAHLAVSLERLQELAGPFQRIGLSATQRPLDEVARFLGGVEGCRVSGVGCRVNAAPAGSEVSPAVTPPGQAPPPASPSPQQNQLPEERSLPDTLHPTPDTLPYRPIRIVDAGRGKELRLLVETPVEDGDDPAGPAAGGNAGSFWASMHPLLIELIRGHRSTLIFVNSRRQAERLASALNDLAGDEICHAHHGSVAREQRLLIEERLKSGLLPALVATSSLELGIDMGAIDLVVQVEAPPSVASGVQRIGRAGHQVGAPSYGVIVPKYRGDLLACAALTRLMCDGAVEETTYPRNPLDVLAQQIVAMVSMDDWTVADLERVVRRAAPFADLPHPVLVEVLDMLSGRYPSDLFSELRPRITWDRRLDTLHARQGARNVAIANAGTIPDRGLYGVYLAGAERAKGRVGELDEEMVFESKVGDTFLLGASTWRVEEITHDRVLVSPAPGVPGRMPFWHGDTVGRSAELGRAIGSLVRELRALPRPRAIALLQERHALGAHAASGLLAYLETQDKAGILPDDRTIVVENNLDELGDWRVCILSPFGGRVHAPWAMAIAAMVRDRTGVELDVLWTDDGIVIRFPQADAPPAPQSLLPDPDDVRDLVVRQLGAIGGGAREAQQGSPVNALFASRFREAAARALLLPRHRPGQRMPLWHQRKRAADLLKVTARFGSFPIILETFRECLQDVFDLPALREILEAVDRGEIAVRSLTTRHPSPFASAILFSYVANFIYEGDAPIAERRAQALTVDPAQLQALLGEVDIRELLDREVIAEFEAYLQHLAPGRRAVHADGLHDLLIALGALSLDAILDRVEEGAGRRVSLPDTRHPTPDTLLHRLEQEGRAVPIRLGGETRYIAAEDAARYRDAAGVVLPPGLPDAYLATVRDPLGDLVRRYARTHGPFSAADVARHCGIGVAPVLTALRALEMTGQVVEGEFRPGGTGAEWCDAGVLRALRRKSLARLRREVEPVDPQALARFSLAWHGIGTSGPARPLVEVLARLQGIPLLASALEAQVLPARLPDYDPRDLDLLTASGQVLWIGDEPVGQGDGRIRLYLTDDGPIPAKDEGGRAGPERIEEMKDEKAATSNILTPDATENRGERAGPERTEEMKDEEEFILHPSSFILIRQHLQRRGASFFPQILQAVGGFPAEVLSALWDLVWRGEVTNDTLGPLRALLAPSSSRTADAARRRALQARQNRSSLRHGARPEVPREAAGRWDLVAHHTTPDLSRTAILAARVRCLLRCFGVVTRETANVAGIEGGFSGIYGVLSAMEEAGAVRRGYFVSGMGATQFALPEAVDQIRALREPAADPEWAHLAATDPANPYGVTIPWPESSGRRKPTRSAGASVVLVDGALAAWLTRDMAQITTFLDQVSWRSADVVAAAIAAALTVEIGPGKRRALLVEEVDGGPTGSSALSAALLSAGFSATEQGYQHRG